MTTDEFWDMIAFAKGRVEGLDDPQCERQAELLESYLANLAPADIIDFHRIFRESMQQANDRGLWGAAYIINGGCSVDGFDYFRGWLIAQGRDVFDAAMRDPDTLADVVDGQQDDYEGEFMLYVGADAYEAKTGVEMPRIVVAHGDIRGEDWTEDTVGQRFPRLAALHRWD